MSTPSSCQTFLSPTSPPTKKRKCTSNPNRKPRKKKQPPTECPICLTPVPPRHLHTLPTCNCTYCTSCLREAFTVGLANNRLNFPTRCCGRPLDLHSHEKQLPAILRRAYDRATEEMASSNPLYCAKEGCGEFILVGTVRDGFGTCGMCHRKTCDRCKMLKQDHLGSLTICPGELRDEALEKLAEEKGWKRCPKCCALIEKVAGCNDMRCMCKTEWCYKCGKGLRRKDGCKCHEVAIVELERTSVDRVEYSTRTGEEQIAEERSAFDEFLGFMEEAVLDDVTLKL